MRTNSIALHVKVLALIALISIPIGYYIYNKNSEKITYVAYLKAGNLLTEDYCVNFTEMPSINLLDGYELGKIERKANIDYQLFNPSYKGIVSVGFIKDKRLYQVNYGGKLDDLEKIKNALKDVNSGLINAEQRVFKESYSKVKLHCNNKIFSVYKYQAHENEDHIYVINESYKKLHLFLAAVTPALILCFMYIIFLYWRINRKSLMDINY